MHPVPDGTAKQRTGRATGTAGLYFCGFFVSATGMLRDIGIDARRIAERITGVA
jgi:hypothetical protein